MDSKTWLGYYEASPQAVKDYLLDQLAVQNEQAAQKKTAYDNDAWDRVMDVAWEAIFAGLSQADFREKLTRLAGDRKPEDVERALLFHVVLPLGDLVIWDVDSRLQELGVPLADIQSAARVSLRPVSYGAAVRRIASLAKISLLQEEMARRLREAFVSYIKGVRTIEQVKEIMQRNQGEGGCGFSREQADRYVETMTDFLATTQVMSEQDYADYLTNFEREEESKQAAATAPAPAPTADEAEIETIAAQSPKPSSAMLDQAIEAAMTLSAVPSLDAYAAGRLRNIISTRLRDVRSAIQLKQILARDVKVGGLGLDAAETDRVAALIEQAYQQYREPIAQEEQRQIQGIITEQKTKIEERKQRESEEHAEWYREKTQQSPETALRALMRPAGLPPKGPEFVPATAANQKGVTASVSMPSAVVAGTWGQGKPTLDEVQPPVRLTGLTDELANMTMADFRRLAKTPEQAVEKIRQKLETLTNESFDRWVEGVEAWRKSPIQQQYLKIVAESFAQGRQVAQTAEAKHEADPDMPTPAELGAIIALNSQEEL